MAEAAQLLSLARASVAAERGPHAVKQANSALDAFKKTSDVEGTREASSLVVTALTLDGQASEAISMVADLSGKEKDQKQLRLLDVLKVDALLAQGQHEEALKLAENALERDTGKDDDKGTSGKCLLASAKAHLAMGNSKPAVIAAEKAAACFNKAGDDSGEASAWMSVMTARFAARDVEGATSASYAALALYGEMGDKQGEAVVLLRFSEAQLKRKFFAEALPAASHALTYLRQTGGGRLEIDALVVAVGALESLGKSSEAVSIAKQSVASARRLGVKLNEGRALQLLAKAHGADGWPDLAAENANDALFIFQQAGDKRMQATVQQDVARLYFASHWFEAGAEAGESAAELYKELDDSAAATAMEDLVKKIRSAAEVDSEAQWGMVKTFRSERERDLSILVELIEQVKLRDEDAVKEQFAKIRGSKFLTQEDYWRNIFDGNEDAEDDFTWMFARLGNKDVKNHRHLLSDGKPLYMMMRHGGMHYGPGFRLNHMVGAAGDNMLSALSYGILTLHALDKEPNHAWEDLSWYHAGILDCALQCQGAKGMRLENPSLEFITETRLINDLTL